jgi:hypothetical protein
MGTKCVRQLAAFVVVFACCIESYAAEPPKRMHKDGQASSTSLAKKTADHPEVDVAQAAPVDPAKCKQLAEKLTQIKTEEKTLKDGPRIMLCTQASCVRLSDKFRKYRSTFTLHADLKAKTIELRHVKEADREAETPKVTYSFFVDSGEDTEAFLACFGNKPLKATVVVQSFVKVPGEDDAHLKFRANVLDLEASPPAAEKM